MSKAIAGAIEIAGVVALFAVAPYSAPLLALVTSTAGSSILAGIGLSGVASEISAIATALSPGPSTFSIQRQPAQSRQVVYGYVRVDGALLFESSTGSKKRLNHIKAWASHAIEDIVALYFDGKQVHFAANGFNGTDGTWGQGDGQTYTSAAGYQYSFGNGVYVEHRFGRDQQTVRDHSGNAAPLYMTSLEGNDSTWTSTHTLNGIAYSYVKLDYDSSEFPGGEPSMKAVIKGKNDILDPRTGSRGYTTNAALIIADYLTNPDFGWGIAWTDIDLPELIASANVCDEEVETNISDLMEPRYSINGSFTLDAERGSILQSMCENCDGRVIETGGKYKIIVGYDRGVSYSFDEGDLTDAIEFNTTRGGRGRFNSVQGTFLCPRFPYTPVGNFYDANNPEQGTFDGAWQPTTYPAFELNADRGYPTYPLTDENGTPILDGNGVQEQGDVFEAADCGRRLYADFKLQFTTSSSQAQRLAKIKLMRYRMETTATLPVKIGGLRICAGDNILQTFRDQGWINKEFQVLDWTMQPKEDDQGNTKLETLFQVSEIDPVALYAWSASDDLKLNAVTYVQQYDPTAVDPPTSVTAISSGIRTSDGVWRPQIAAGWVLSDDPTVVGYTVQLQQSGGTTWVTQSQTLAGESMARIDNVVQDQTYLVRVAARKQNGMLSAWAQSPSVTISDTETDYPGPGI